MIVVNLSLRSADKRLHRDTENSPGDKTCGQNPNKSIRHPFRPKWPTAHTVSAQARQSESLCVCAHTCVCVLLSLCTVPVPNECSCR